MKNKLQLNEFVDKALKFKLEIEATTSFNEKRSLWFKSSIPV